MSPSERSSPVFAPFIIIGAGRGGTSLLAASLAGHSRLVVDFEFLGVSGLMGYDLPAGGSPNVFSERIRFFRAGCLRRIKECDGKIWGNKITTEQLFGLEDHHIFNLPYCDLLERFFREAVPDFRVIFILRDGRSCTASKVRRTSQSWEQAAYRWHYSIKTLKAVRNLQQPIHVLKFEDLVHEPARTLTEVAMFLGVAFEESMLQQTQNIVMPSAYRRDGFDPSKSALVELPAHIYAFLKPDLEYCEYA
jgi:hypothetical protein